MHTKDAFKILGLDGITNPEITKTAYRKAVSKYHPDRNPAGLEIMKMVNVAYETVKDYIGDCETTTESIQYGDDLAEALNAIMMFDLIIEICGAWVWVSGDTKPCREILKENGFKWASKKLMWYFRPDDYKSKGKGKHSIDEIREKYGSERVYNKQTKISA